MWVYGLDWAGPGQRQVADACECGNEPSGSVKCVEFLDQLQTSQLLKKDSAPWSKCVRGKVKCTLVQALRLCTGRTAYRGSSFIPLLFLDHGTKRGEGVSVTPQPHFTPGKDPVPIVQEAGWDPGPVWTDAENLASHQYSIPGPSSPQPVAIPTELPGPLLKAKLIGMKESVVELTRYFLNHRYNFLRFG